MTGRHPRELFTAMDKLVERGIITCKPFKWPIKEEDRMSILRKEETESEPETRTEFWVLAVQRNWPVVVRTCRTYEEARQTITDIMESKDKWVQCERRPYLDGTMTEWLLRKDIKKLQIEEKVVEE